MNWLEHLERKPWVLPRLVGVNTQIIPDAIKIQRCHMWTIHVRSVFEFYVKYLYTRILIDIVKPCHRDPQQLRSKPTYVIPQWRPILRPGFPRINKHWVITGLLLGYCWVILGLLLGYGYVIASSWWKYWVIKLGLQHSWNIDPHNYPASNKKI